MKEGNTLYYPVGGQHDSMQTRRAGQFLAQTVKESSTSIQCGSAPVIFFSRSPQCRLRLKLTSDPRLFDILRDYYSRVYGGYQKIEQRKTVLQVLRLLSILEWQIDRKFIIVLNLRNMFLNS